MSRDKTNIVETDVVIFEMPHREAARTEIFEQADNKVVSAQEDVSVIKKDRFARLKRSLRKKSVSIL
jgi:hypothetical protein